MEEEDILLREELEVHNSKFHKGTKSLDNTISMQRFPLIKIGLGYQGSPSLQKHPPLNLDRYASSESQFGPIMSPKAQNKHTKLYHILTIIQNITFQALFYKSIKC